MGKYRKKPVIVEAEQWFSNKHVDGVFCGFEVNMRWSYPKQMPKQYVDKDGKVHRRNRHWGWIETLEGGHVVSEGDYIITGVAGEKYPCKETIFNETYEKVDG